MKYARFLAASTALIAVALAAFAEITSVPSGTFEIPSPPLFTNSILSGTNELPLLETKKLDEFPSLSPGVYRTEPYACMVMVPGVTHDDICQKLPPVPNQPMPVLRPELKTVPPDRSDK